MQALVKVLQNYFGDIHLKDFNPIMIQRFIDDLCQREIVQDLAKLKEGKSLRELVKAKRMVAKKIGKFVGVNYSVFSSAHRGNRILYKNAVDLCEGLGIDFDDYFAREIRYCPTAYASSAKPGSSRSGIPPYPSS